MFEEVGEKIGGAFQGKKGKILLIGGGAVAVFAFVMMQRRSAAPAGEEVSLSGYPQAPTANVSAGDSTVADQMAALSDTFTDSLTNMNTQFTDVLNAQQQNFQGQIDQLASQVSAGSASYVEGLNFLNENFADQIGEVKQTVANVNTSLIDFASKQAEKNQSYAPLPDISNPYPATATPTTQTAVTANQVAYLSNLASGITPTGGQASAGNQAWAQSELNKITSPTTQKTTTPKPSSPSTAAKTNTAASAAQNQATYLKNLAAGKNPDGSKASAGNVLWAKAQLKK